VGYGSNQVVFSPDGRSLVDFGFGGQPEAIWLWRLSATGSSGLSIVKSATAPRSALGLGAAAFSPDGSRLAVSSDSALLLLDAATLRTIKSTANPSRTSGGPVYSPDGKTLAVGGAPGYVNYLPVGGTVCLLDAASLGMITSRSVSAVDAYSLAFSPDGRRLALVGYGKASGGTVSLLDAGTLRTTARAAIPGGAGATAGFSPDGTVLAGFSAASDVVIWLMRVDTMKIIASARVGPASEVAGVTVDLSADGKTLAVGYTSERTSEAKVLLYRIGSG
jgi:WD40 repeat protein